MSATPRPNQWALAFVIASLADLVQLPLTALLTTGILAIPAELAILAVDLAAMLLFTRLLGFDILLIPAIACELIPVAGAAPTWTLCVAAVFWKRSRTRARAANNQFIDVPSSSVISSHALPIPSPNHQNNTP